MVKPFDVDWSEHQQPTSFDPNTPSTARIYDCLLGGKDNYPADRKAAEKITEIVPEVRHIAWMNRICMQRAVKFMLHEGVRQFIDIGTGIPTPPNVHNLAPTSHVVYVDNDPVALVYARALLAGGESDPNVRVLNADMCDPDAILASQEVREHIDFNQPVGVLLMSMLHFATDQQNPQRIVETLRRPLPPGSFIALTHVTSDFASEEQLQRLSGIYEDATSPLVFRSRRQIGSISVGSLVDPGLVPVRDWRGDIDPPMPKGLPLTRWMYAMVAAV